MENKYIYILLCKGSDGKFTTSAFESFEKAQKTLEMYIEAQKEIEGLGNNIYIDRHEHERLRLPEFIMRDDDILSHVTVNYVANYDMKDRVVQTDRYIIRVAITQ
jgi:hypothetical protein